MNKIGFLLSGLLVLWGVNLLAFCLLADAVYPVTGRPISACSRWRPTRS